MILIVILFGFLIFKNNNLIKDKYTDYKNLTDIISNIVSILILVIGAILSYFKFFKGRVFKENLELIAFAKVFKINKKSNSILFNIKIQNIGNISITNPKTYMTIEYLDDDNTLKLIDVDLEVESTTNYKNWNVIEPKANFNVHLLHKLKKDISAIRFHFQLISDKNNTWSRIVTIPNTSEFEYRQD
jgi:hypothetical protein